MKGEELLVIQLRWILMRHCLELQTLRQSRRQPLTIKRERRGRLHPDLLGGELQRTHQQHGEQHYQSACCKREDPLHRALLSLLKVGTQSCAAQAVAERKHELQPRLVAGQLVRRDQTEAEQIGGGARVTVRVADHACTGA